MFGLRKRVCMEAGKILILSGSKAKQNSQPSAQIHYQVSSATAKHCKFITVLIDTLSMLRINKGQM